MGVNKEKFSSKNESDKEIPSKSRVFLKFPLPLWERVRVRGADLIVDFVLLKTWT
jgi:hypothetical protein